MSPEFREMNRLVTMILRIALRRLVSSGVNHGIRAAASRGGRAAADDVTRGGAGGAFGNQRRAMRLLRLLRR